MVSNRLGLVLDDDAALPDLEAAAARLRALLPGIDADRFAEAFPAVLDVDDFERALEARRRRRKGGMLGRVQEHFWEGAGAPAACLRRALLARSRLKRAASNTTIADR